LIEDVKLQVKNGKEIGNKFCTNIGVPQGDCLSPILFTFYLANALKQQNDNIPEHLSDHNYCSNTTDEINLDQQFADDLGWLNNSSPELDCIKAEKTNILKNRNLIINDSKTERYSIKSKSDTEWKKCKYLGSFLDTETDIIRRKQLSMVSFKNHQHKLTSKKLSLKTRLRFFNVFVTSIFMYNSELWVLTKKLENDIDIFHRKLLRRILKIFYPFTIRNETLYYRTNESKWSNKIKTRRLR